MRTILLAVLLAYPLLQIPPAPDSLSGGAGWVGTGLLGSVLAWLLFIHLPAKDKILQVLVGEMKGAIAEKDKQLDGIVASKDKQLDAALEHKWQVIQSMSNDHRDNIKIIAMEFRTAVQEVTAHCDKEVERIARLLGEREEA